MGIVSKSEVIVFIERSWAQFFCKMFGKMVGKW